MIDSIEIKNFQVLDHIKLDFVPGINVIIGETDNGKSSIIRALNWATRNDPLGDEFVNDEKKDCSAVITTANNTVQRIRGKNKNKFVINGSTFDAPRGDVPDQLKEIINITSTNIQFQDDSAFLISLNGGEAARKINAITGMDQIDTSIKYVNALVREQNAHEKQIKQEIKNKQQKLLRFATLDEAVRLHQKLEKYIEELRSFDESTSKIESILSDLKKLKNVLDLEEQINSLEEKTKRIQTRTEKIDEFDKEIQNLKKYTSIIQKEKTFIQTYTKKQKRIQDIMQSIETKQGEFEEIDKKIISTKKITLSLSQANSKIQELQKVLGDAQKHFDDFKSSFDVCPIIDKPCKLLTGGK